MRLLNDDCLSVMSEFSENSIDMILADLPFGTTRQKWDKVIDMQELWKTYERIIKPNGAIVLFAKPPFDKVLACSNLTLYRYDWIWEKSRATGHLNANRMPLQSHENICVFYKKQPVYNPQKTTGHRPVNSFYTRSSGDIYGKADGIKHGGGNTDRYPRSVLKYSPVPNKNRLHPNQKPTELLNELILTYTNKGETVLDNTMGSGSTGVSCLYLDRKFIGIESDLSIFKTAKKSFPHE